MKCYRGLNYFGIIISLLFFAMLFCNTNSEIIGDVRDRQSVVINEICADNFSTAPVQYRENADWIELYNVSDFAVNLEGWAISDEAGDLAECCIFPEIILQPHEYYTIYATEYAEDKVAVKVGPGRKNTNEAAVVTFDGSQSVNLIVGDYVEITQAKETTRLVKISKKSFVETVRKKMQFK